MFTTLLALAALAAGVGVGPLARRLQEYRAEPEALADLVQWALLATPEVIWNKDGAFVGAFEFSGPDLSFATADQTDHLADQTAQALGVLDERHMLHVDQVRLPSRAYRSEHHHGRGTANEAIAEEASPPLARLIDRQRRARHMSGTHFEDRFFLALTYLPPAEIYERAARLFFTGGPRPEAIDWKGTIADFEGRLSAFTRRLPDDLGLRRLRGGALLSYLRLMLYGEDHPVTPPPGPAHLDFLFDRPLRGGFEPKVGDRWTQVVGVQGYPDTAAAGITRALETLPFPFRYSTRLIGTSAEGARALLRQRMNTWSLKRRGAREQLVREPGDEGDAAALFLDTWADDLTRDAQEARRKLTAGSAHMLHATHCLIVASKRIDTCDERAARAEKTLRSAGAGFVVRRERGIATEALIGSWPGHGHQNVRRYPLLSDYAARLLPLTSTYPGPRATPCAFQEEGKVEEGALSPVDGSKYAGRDGGDEGPAPLFYAKTREHVPFRFSPYVGDVGHQMIIGPTGTGKSILMGFQAMRQLQYTGGQAVLLDSGGSFAPLCEALDGQHYDAGDPGTSFQPLAEIDRPSERRWATGWITRILMLQGLSVTPSARRLIRQALETMAARSPEERSHRTLQELRTQVQSREIKAALDPYCDGGALGTLLDAAGTSVLHRDSGRPGPSRQDSTGFQAAGPRDRRFQVIELAPLLQLEEALVTPVLLYLFHRIEKMLSPKRPTFVGADEFFLLAARSEIGRTYAEEAMRTYRKKNAALAIATQAPTDVALDGLASILSSCRTRIFLPNPDALDPAQRQGYEAVGLSAQHIHTISQAVPRREYLSVQPAGTRLWALGLEEELAFMTAEEGSTFEETAAAMRRYKEEYGEGHPGKGLPGEGVGTEGGWLEPWLRRRGYGLSGVHRMKPEPSTDAAEAVVPIRTPPATELRDVPAPT
jgi:type IV secretion system protein VirB4